MNPPLSEFRRWLRFNAVGGIGICVQLASLAVLRGMLGVDYLLATAIAVELTVLHNFAWHERYTWADRSGESRLIRLLKFNISTGVFSIAGNLLAMKVMVDGLHVHYIIANLISVAVCSLLNYVVADRAVFLHRPVRENINCD